MDWSTYMFKADLKTLGKAVVFKISKGQISKTINRDELSFLQKIRVERAKARYGSNLNQIINFDEIDFTELKDYEIVIQSYSVNKFNGNGVIKIPCEVENFISVKKYIQGNMENFKVKKT